MVDAISASYSSGYAARKENKSWWDRICDNYRYNTSLIPEQGLSGWELYKARWHNQYACMTGIFTDPWKYHDYMKNYASYDSVFSSPERVNRNNGIPKGYAVELCDNGNYSVHVTNGNFGARQYTPEEYRHWLNTKA